MPLNASPAQMALHAMNNANPPIANASPPIPTPVPPSSKWQLGYDIAMMVAIVLDLLLMGLDSFMLSSFALQLGEWLNVSDWITTYEQHWHHWLKVWGGIFTLFLVVELLVRWAMAVKQKRYYRWFFFPFVHWYEVLGCAPQLRALRLLRVGVIGYRLYRLGYQILPKSWIKSGIFYYEVVLEEISDRVIVTAIDNIRQELYHTKGQLVQSVIDNHRAELQTVITELLTAQVTPLLIGTDNQPTPYTQVLATQVGTAIHKAIGDTPELHRILRLIPIAGGLIESQIQSIGQHIGENLTHALSQNLLQPDNLTAIYAQIAKSVADINTSSPTLEKLVRDIIFDSLNAVEKQVKIQQWKEHLA